MKLTVTRSITYLILSAALISCNQKDTGKHVDKIDSISKAIPVVLDTIGVDRYMHLSEDEDQNLKSTSNYRFFYIGKIGDTIYLNPFIDFSSVPPPALIGAVEIAKNEERNEFEKPYKKYAVEWDSEKRHMYWMKAKIEILIDTVSRIDNTFSVVLTNKETDTIFIGYGRHIPLVMEAIDSTGSWLPIQEKYLYMCGNGVNSVVLPPNECVATLAPVFKGNYKTKLRLTIGENHSKAFGGSINYTKFR